MPGMSYIAGGLGVVALIGWGMFYMLDNKYDDLLMDSAKKIERAETNTRTAEKALKTTQTSLKTLRAQQLADYKAQGVQDAERAQDRKELADLQNKLNSYRKRWENVANKKPGILARVINRATRKRVLAIQAATCRTACDTDETDDGSSEPREPS